MFLLVLVHLFTGNEVYILLFNIDYIPLLRDFRPRSFVEIVFHFITCIVSTVGLYTLLKIIRREQQLISYFVIYTAGSAFLFFFNGSNR